MVRHLIALAFVFLCSAFCGGENCANHLKEVPLTCETATYTQTVILHMPDEAGPQLIKYSCTSVDCCGELKTTCLDGGACDAAVHSAEVRARIDDVAKTSQVLVADCDGRYAPYVPRAERTINLDRVVAADHILR